jgi:ribose-phosphate pyrophosphokinase
MSLRILSGSANRPLTEIIARKLGVQFTPVALERFPDSELHVEVQESVRGHNVYIIQPTCPPVDEHLLELLLRDGVKDGRWGHLEMGSGPEP